MKETTGELNMTLVVVLAVAVLVAFFYFIIWPELDSNFQANSKCSRAICKNPCIDETNSSRKNACEEALTGEKVSCYYIDNKGNKHEDLYCPWKG